MIWPLGRPVRLTYWLSLQQLEGDLVKDTLNFVFNRGILLISVKKNLTVDNLDTLLLSAFPAGFFK